MGDLFLLRFSPFSDQLGCCGDCADEMVKTAPTVSTSPTVDSMEGGQVQQVSKFHTHTVD